MLLVQIPNDLQRALEDYCKENKTTPSETISDLLAGLLLHADCILVEDTGLSVYDVIAAFCTLDSTRGQTLSPDQIKLISRVRAGVHDIWMDSLASE